MYSTQKRYCNSPNSTLNNQPDAPALNNRLTERVWPSWHAMANGVTPMAVFMRSGAALAAKSLSRMRLCPEVCVRLKLWVRPKRDLRPALRVRS